MKVFVYGSLKEGYWNNIILRDSNLIDTATTVDDGYNMIDLGGFPAVLRGGTFKIDGELYDIDEKVLDRLDSLEGNGHFYNREIVQVKTSSGDTVNAWMYIFVENSIGVRMAAYNSHTITLTSSNSKVWQE